MNLRKLVGLLALPILVWMSGCQTLYNPSLPQVPLMMGGDETQVALNAGSSGYGMQLAYSPYYHWVITANGSTFSVFQDTSLLDKYRQIQGEIGTGFYTTVNRHVRFEVLTGLGGGSSGINDTRSLYRKVFLQPSIGISSRFLDAGLTSRFSFAQHYLDKSPAGEAKMNGNAMFWEPGVMMRVGYEQVKFNFQVSWSFPMGTSGLAYRRLALGGGVHITLFRDFDRFMH